MTVKQKVQEAKKGIDNLIPVKESPGLGKHDYHQINVTVPNPTITFEPYEDQLKIMDVIAGVALALGFIALGFSLHGM